ncbi:hypothetical protein HF521_015993 [Silurus meridionalis]|uniref:Uncharacterized protein n=1 Tax=Silurus meridionalis TaxID=175797 RepID=A0A8T0BRW8_SILME|nr:hypothetical protein HF521_015993 [Silurus meridionalis]
MSVSDTILCFGYEKLCVEKLGKSAGALASVPLISESELSQAEDETLHSFTCGTFTKMTNYSWRGIRITVKELQVNIPHADAQQHYYHNLLITELNFCWARIQALLHSVLQLFSSSVQLSSRSASSHSSTPACVPLRLRKTPKYCTR